ncbi:MAG: helix-turn-helix domain-containing protein [Steroidobacteraceae bacterium]
MRQTEAIHGALKRVIRRQGQTYAAAARVLELSEASVKRLFSRGELSLDRLERLCDWLGVDIAGVVALSENAQPLVTELDSQQEWELLRDPTLLLVSILVLNGWSQAEMLDTYRIEPAELQRKLRRLEQLGLIELLPVERIRLRTARNFAWRKDGPIQEFFAARVLPEFVATRFDGPGEHMRFVSALLSRSSLQKLQASVDALAREFDELMAQDLKLPIDQRFGASMFVGIRPWEYSEFAKRRKRPRPRLT